MPYAYVSMPAAMGRGWANAVVSSDCMSLHLHPMEFRSMSLHIVVIKESSGVFLCVALVLRDMDKFLGKIGYSESDLNERVKNLPKELGGEDGFYNQLLLSLSTNGEEDMKQEERARRIFYWVIFPKRPISVAELQDVSATPLSHKMDLCSYSFAYNRPLELNLGILSACGGLVEVSGMILTNRQENHIHRITHSMYL